MGTLKIFGLFLPFSYLLASYDVGGLYSFAFWRFEGFEV